MKRMISIIMFLLLLTYVSVLWAEDKEETKKVSTLIILKNDWIKPENSGGYFSYATTLWWHYDKWLGFGADLTIQPEKNYVETNPFVTVNKGPYYLVGGYSTNSSGEDYLHAGVWYYNTRGKWQILADLRNWWGVAGKTSDYLDNYLEATYKINDRLSVGPVIVFDHWWNEDHNLIDAGPMAYYKLNSNIYLIGRYLYEWNWKGGKTSETQKFRLGIEICF